MLTPENKLAKNKSFQPNIIGMILQYTNKPEEKKATLAYVGKM